MQRLQKTLSDRQDVYRDALDRLMNHVENDPEAHDARHALREAIELVGCLRRLVAGVSVEDVHRAFGAPGDFGYDTPVGDALADLYRGVSS